MTTTDTNYRERMIDAANDAIEARWETCRTNRDEIELIIDAILPPGSVVVEVPVVPYPGASSQADFYRSAAQHVLGGYTVGGSNLSRAVGTLLHSVADRLES